MSEFYDLLDEYLGDNDSLDDIRVMVRRNWFYDFKGYPIRVWQGQGRLFTSDGNIWLGTIDANGRDIHTAPAISDGRDGTSANYSFSLTIPDLPGMPAQTMYDAIKADSIGRVAYRNLTQYLTIFKEGEGIRPSTPISFFKELSMINVSFSEKLALDSNGVMTKTYVATVLTKDGNFGRSNVPNGTYADAIQKARALEYGVALDRGCEFLARLADRTYQLP